MLVSIITPTYNSSQFIFDTYNSIASQIHQNWEWIITDDCSTDNTFSILMDIARSDCRVKIFQNSINCGAAVSRNNSLHRATGVFVAFLDSDDLWKPDKLERQIKFMGDNIDFSFTSYTLINEKGELIGKSIDKNRAGTFNYRDMLKKKATLGCSTVMLRKSAFSEIKMPLIRTGQDYALWLQLLKNGKVAHILQHDLTFYRIVPNSISRNKIKKAIRQWQIYRNIEKLNLLKSSYYFLFYAFRAVFR